MRRLCKESGGYAVTSLCKLFGVTKQAFYKYVDHSMDCYARERFVLEFVKRVRAKDPGIGGEKLWLMYRNEFGCSQAFVGRDYFCAILSKYNLTVRKRFRAPRTTDSSHYLPQYPDLTRTLLPSHPNQLWVSDITYITIWLPEGSYMFCYLSLVTDAYTKEIMGYCVGDTLGSCYTVEALEMAIERIRGIDAKGLIHHSDRGVQYASADYISVLRHNGILPSMTEKGNPRDNAIAERVNGIIKNELLQGMRFRSMEEVQKAIAIAVHFYNNERPHMSLNMSTPVQAGKMEGPIKKKWISYREKYLSVVHA